MSDRPMGCTRRDMLRVSGLAVAGMAFGSMTATRSVAAALQTSASPFEISLAQWSLHKAFFDKKADPMDFAKIAKEEFGINAIEYVNQFYKGKAEDQAFLADLKKRADDHGVKSLLIMCDGEGALGDADEAKRKKAVENHYKWVAAAKYLGCHSIRVNAQSGGSYDEQLARAADGLRRLTEFAATHDINVIVENHGGLSSNGAWLAAVMKKVDHPRCGTLPDFGNFRVSKDEMYDRYKGVEELMPFAKAVSAKSHDFDAAGNEIHTDYRKMMKIVASFGYKGYVGIEYEGSKISEADGIKATKKLLETVRSEMA
ncbi:Xylose isomerase domain protein TIM barrel [Planctopirus limnophila DSM 3776]|uniref:Xylose isomerase domain protein TIM barrel n=2 Tax=Planctopirus limnophila (strain ATCC 43296 / DSM 3776 / IFAM 1008 / Mu 290) TaxID=521674 RepID=D5SQK4_PLAL2|nr:sugar phosphate isomerase/epimerase family protein [Planctopirus limnophila]ADG68466.1 Xylose isomerase domain protein TIM barrel [Planctopirus limnophila DSM 3776]